MLALPAEETVEAAIGIIGKRGRGKSGAVKVLMEELVKAKLPFVMFDPVGIAWGLRSSLDGSAPSGAHVLVVGGAHGDVRLERRAGAEVARAIVQANISAIIDFSEEPKSVYREFVCDFSHEIFKVNDTSRLIIIEEAPELVPQRLRPEMTQVFEAVERLVSRGRNRGLGVVLVSQRAATINKDVLTQVDALMVFGLTSPQDRKALREWVEAKADEGHLHQFEEGLASLNRQEAWFWAPEAFGGIFRKVRIRPFATLHPDKTHLRRAGLLKVKPVTTDVTTIVAALGTAVAKISKEKTAVVDAKRLQAQVAKLDAENARLRARPAAPTPSQAGMRRVEIPVVKDGQIQRVERAIDRLEKLRVAFYNDLRIVLPTVEGETKRLAESLDKARGRPPTLSTPRTHLGPMVPRPPLPTRPAPAPEARASVALESGTHDSAPSLRSGERRMLQTLAQRHQLKMTRAQLGTLAGFTPSGGTFSTYFGTLKRHGLLEENGNGTVRISQAGLDFLGEDVPPAPATTAELQAMWKNMVRAGEAKMLDQLVAVYPDGLTRQDLGERTGFTATGGTFSTYLGTLRRNGLVEADGELLKASETLFIDGA